jgi:hypothetical protein
MIHEHRTYRLTPGSGPEFLKIYEAACLPVIGRYAKLAGCWLTETGTLNAVVFIWGYDDLGHRTQQRARLAADPEWGPAVKRILPFIVHQESFFLAPAPFSPT